MGSGATADPGENLYGLALDGSADHYIRHLGDDECY